MRLYHRRPVQCILIADQATSGIAQTLKNLNEKTEKCTSVSEEDIVVVQSGVFPFL